MLWAPSGPCNPLCAVALRRQVHSHILHLRAQGRHLNSHKPLTTCVESTVEGPGIRPRSVGPMQGSVKHNCLSSQAPALQYRTGAGSPATQSPTSPVSNQGFSPGSSPQVRPPPLALCHFMSHVPSAPQCCPPSHTFCPPSTQGRAPPGKLKGSQDTRTALGHGT